MRCLSVTLCLFCLWLPGCGPRIASGPLHLEAAHVSPAALDGQHNFAMVLAQNGKSIPMQGSVEIHEDNGMAAFILAHGPSLGYCFFSENTMNCQTSNPDNRAALLLLQKAGLVLYRALYNPYIEERHGSWSVTVPAFAEQAEEYTASYNDEQAGIAAELVIGREGQR